MFSFQGKRKKRGLQEDIQNVWNEIRDLFEGVRNDINEINDRVEESFDQIIDRVFTARCDDWVAKENENPANFSDLPPPPCTLDQARRDPNFTPDPACREGNGCDFHTPDAYHCIQSRVPRYHCTFI